MGRGRRGGGEKGREDNQVCKIKSNFFNTKYEKKEGLGFGVHSYNWVPHKSGSFPGGLCLMQRID